MTFFDLWGICSRGLQASCPLEGVPLTFLLTALKIADSEDQQLVSSIAATLNTMSMFSGSLKVRELFIDAVAITLNGPCSCISKQPDIGCFYSVLIRWKSLGCI